MMLYRIQVKTKQENPSLSRQNHFNCKEISISFRDYRSIFKNLSKFVKRIRRTVSKKCYKKKKLTTDCFD